jgi:hypothetical protein
MHIYQNFIGIVFPAYLPVVKNARLEFTIIKKSCCVFAPPFVKPERSGFYFVDITNSCLQTRMGRFEINGAAHYHHNLQKMASATPAIQFSCN